MDDGGLTAAMLRRQKQLLVEMDRHNARRVKGVAQAYRRRVIGPIVEGILQSESKPDALLNLGARTLRRMACPEFEKALADATVQMGCIGRAAAMPRRMKREERRSK